MLPTLVASSNAVFVNKYCEFGWLSEKAYVFNRGSAELFLGSTLQLGAFGAVCAIRLI